MFNRNNGSSEQDILQNQFSAYVKKAVHNKRLRYLYEQNKRTMQLVDLVNNESMLIDETDYIQNIVDFNLICQLLRSIKEKERYIILARIVDEKSFKTIADELGMTYKAVTSLYYRVMIKLKGKFKGGDNDEF